jgi:hypothetical protein
MPWTWLARAFFALIAYGVIRRRQQGKPVIDTPAVRRRLDVGLHAGLIAARAITTLTLAVVTVVLATVATSTLLLGPRWLGGALAVIVVVFAVAAVQEGVLLRRELTERRRREHLRAIADEVDRPHIV